MNLENKNAEQRNTTERQERGDTIKNRLKNLKNAAAFTMALGGAMESAKAEVGPGDTVSVKVPGYSVEFSPAESSEIATSLENFAAQFADYSDVIQAYLNGDKSASIDEAVEASIAGDRLAADVAMERQVQSATLGSTVDDSVYVEAVEKMESAKAAFDKLSGELFNKLDAMAAADQNPANESSLDDLFAEADGIIEDDDATAGKAERPSLEGLDTNFEQNETMPETFDTKVWDFKSVIDGAVAKSAGEGNMDVLPASEIADQLAVAATHMVSEYENLQRSIENDDKERIARYERRLKEAFAEYITTYEKLSDMADKNIQNALDNYQILQPASVDSLFPSL